MLVVAVAAPANGYEPLNGRGQDSRGGRGGAGAGGGGGGGAGGARGSALKKLADVVEEEAKDSIHPAFPLPPTTTPPPPPLLWLLLYGVREVRRWPAMRLGEG